MKIYVFFFFFFLPFNSSFLIIIIGINFYYLIRMHPVGFVCFCLTLPLCNAQEKSVLPLFIVMRRLAATRGFVPQKDPARWRPCPTKIAPISKGLRYPAYYILFIFFIILSPKLLLVG